MRGLLNHCNRRGVTLAEMLVSIFVMGIIFIAFAKVFPIAQESIQRSKVNSLATNLAQEKMQILKQQSYYSVIVTTNVQTITTVSPTVYYDPGYYAPETILEGGIRFRRYTLVEVVEENSGTLQLLPPSTPDTGMKQITVSLVWQMGNDSRVITTRSVLTNPNTVMMVSRLSGIVRNAVTTGGIRDAVVTIAENVGWRDNTDASGNYTINISSGIYNVVASADGYFDQMFSITMAPNSSQSITINMSPMSSGTVRGYAWVNPSLVITQVVASTGPSNSVEYVELYNPTTSPINIGTNAGYSTPNVWMVAWDAAGTAAHQRQLVYISTYVAPNRFYLISNTGDGGGAGAAISCAAIGINGSNVNPDACWRFVGTPNHTLQCNPITLPGCAAGASAGGFAVGTNGGAVWSGVASFLAYDSVAWSGTGSTPAGPTEGTAITPLTATGLQANEAFVRRVDTTTATSGSFGNAYDSGDNSVDFVRHGTIPYAPRGTGTSLPARTGKPARGAIVSITDMLSSPTSAYMTGTPARAEFSVPRVATGTWTVFLTSGSVYAQISTVTITGNTTTWVPNNFTSPTGSSHTIVNTQAINGYLTGRVLRAGNLPISPAVTISMGGVSALASTTNGYYFLQAPPGYYTATANPNNTNPNYVSQDQSGLAINLGQVTSDVDFVLSQGGRLTGRSTRDGTNALSGITYVALNSLGIQMDQVVSDSNGFFTLVNLTTGTYTIRPSLDEGEISTPLSSTAAVTAGALVNIGTFTITGAFGSIAGNVTASSSPIRTGTLIIVTTTTIGGTLPTISSNSLTGATYYLGSSQEDGSYSIGVRGSTSTTYNAYAYYTTISGSSVSVSTRTRTGISVTPGLTTSGQNFVW